jgi:hypothetical protein
LVVGLCWDCPGVSVRALSKLGECRRALAALGQDTLPKEEDAKKSAPIERTPVRVE